jgi:hypothetical protein
MKTFSCKPASIPKARWAAYAAAGAATALGGTPSADAEIHYSGLVNHDFANGPFTGPLDPGVSLELFVGTGTHVGNTTNHFGAMFIRTPPSDQSTIGAFVGTEAWYAGFYLLELPARVSLLRQRIGNYCKYFSTCTCNACFGGYIGGSGRFRDRGIGFIGFAFSHGAGLHYGWARVQTSGPPDYRFVLVDYAWGDVGDRIKTGQRSSSGDMVDTVTDSGSVGLLALGAAGLVAWRKQRGQATR